MGDDQDYDEEEPLARWEALLLPDWTWEAYEKEGEEPERYYGRVKSPNTYGEWEWGYFTEDQLEEAGAYRVDVDIESGEDLFPDGGWDDIVAVFETEFNAQHYRDDTDDR